LMSKSEDEDTLKKFYKNVRPWGFWGPIRAKVMQEDSTFQPNGDFGRDCINVAVGIVWQMTLVMLPIYIVLRDWNWVGGIFVLLAATSTFLKFNWYDKLEKAPATN
jgi:SSS family solute:Na+ symporter